MAHRAITTRLLLILALSAACPLAATSESGTMKLEITSVGVGVGFDWGHGSFNVDGREIPFTISGYRVSDVGVMRTQATGTVSNVGDVRDLEGKYTARAAGFAVGGGPTTITLANKAGVEIRLSGISRGLGASLAAEGGDIVLGEIPELPEVAAPPPAKREVAAAPPPEPEEPDPCEETVRFPGVLFEFDASHLTRAGEQAIGKVAQRLMECRDERVVVDGYTDDVGTDAYNQRLSQRRADAVKLALSQAGVSLERIDARGHGETDPIASNDSDEGRAQNRRAEISTP